MKILTRLSIVYVSCIFYDYSNDLDPTWRHPRSKNVTVDKIIKYDNKILITAGLFQIETRFAISM